MMQSWWLVSFMLIIHAVLNTAQLFGDNVCQKQEVYTVSIQVKYKEPVTITTYTWCLKIPPRCAKEKVILRDKYKVLYEPRTRLVNVCCEGYAPDRNGTKCVPVCSGDHTCLHGRCEGPDRCICEPGYTGQQCDRVCPPGFYGQDCSGMCNCQNNGTCHHMDGVCLCTAGWSGPQCQFPCPEGTYGKNCLSKCQCNSKHEMCHPYNGTCISVREFLEEMAEEIDFDTVITDDGGSSGGEIMIPVESKNRKDISTDLPALLPATISVKTVTFAPIQSTVKSSVYDIINSDNIMHIPKKIIKKEPVIEDDDFETIHKNIQEDKNESIKTYSTSTTFKNILPLVDDKYTTQTVPYTISEDITMISNEGIFHTHETKQNLRVSEESYDEIKSNKPREYSENIDTPMIGNANVKKSSVNYFTESGSSSESSVELDVNDTEPNDRISATVDMTNSSYGLFPKNINSSINDDQQLETSIDKESSESQLTLNSGMTSPSHVNVRNVSTNQEERKTSVSDDPVRINVNTTGDKFTTKDDMKTNDSGIKSNTKVNDKITTVIANKRPHYQNPIEQSFPPISEEFDDNDEKNIIDHEQLKQVFDTQATVREQAIHNKGTVFRGISDLVFSVCVAAGVAITLILVALGIILVVHRRRLRKTLLVTKVPKSGDTLGMSIYSGSTVYTNADDIVFPERDIHARCVFTGPDITATAGECHCEKKQIGEENTRRDCMTCHYDIPPPARSSLTATFNEVTEPIYEEIPGWSSRTTSFQTFSNSPDNTRG